MPKQEKIALVTGANKGIGFEVARQLAAKGFRVFIGARNEKAGRDAAKKIGERAIFLKIDVSDRASIGKAAKEFERAADHLDVLVNNAGILLDEDKSVLTMTPGDFRNNDAHEHARTDCSSCGVRTFAEEIRHSAHRQCFERRRTTNRRRRRMGAGILHFENGVKWRDRSARSGITEIRGEFRLPRLGANRHGRSWRQSVSRTRRGYDCMARERRATKSHRKILA